MFSDGQLLKAIVDTSDDAIVATTLNGHIAAWNTAAESMFGYSAQEALGRHISIIVPVDRRGEQDDIMRRLRAGHRITRAETVRCRSDGTRLAVELSITPVLTADGLVAGAVSVIRDLMERLGAQAALRAEEERFRVLADNISQLAWMADDRGLIFWYNERWFEYTGTTLDEARGWGWTLVHHPEHVERVVSRIQHSWDTGEPWEDEFPLRGRDGAYRWFLSRAQPIHDPRGRIVRWFGTSTDITAQRQLAEELRSISAELQVMNQRKDEFLAALSHEIRNPLGAIRTGLALARTDRLQGADVARNHTMLERQVSQLARLLNDLFDVSRSTQGRLAVIETDVDLLQVLEDTVVAVGDVFHQAGVTLTCRLPTGPLPARADPARVQQMLANVLSNAARYTPRGGRAELVVTTDRRDVVATVSDSGVGIAQALLPEVFDLFTQSQPDAAAAKTGLGVGLYLARQLAARHGGTITAESDGPGLGSRFTVRLPVLLPHPLESDTSRLRAGGGVSVGGRRILVVDDDPDNAEALATWLRMARHVVEVARDGPTAIALACRFLPQVILLDIGLPGMDGVETCGHLRQVAGLEQCTIVAVTGWGQPADIERTRAAGFTRHLVKPVEPQHLLTLLSGAAAGL